MVAQNLPTICTVKSIKRKLIGSTTRSASRWWRNGTAERGSGSGTDTSRPTHSVKSAWRIERQQLQTRCIISEHSQKVVTAVIRTWCPYAPAVTAQLLLGKAADGDKLVDNLWIICGYVALILLGVGRLKSLPSLPRGAGRPLRAKKRGFKIGIYW